MANFAGDRYELAEMLRQGRAYSLFRARRVDSDEPLVVKVLHGFAPSDADGLAARYEELRNLYEIRHPRLARPFDFSHWGNSYYFVEEYREGLTLDDALQHESWTLDHTLELASQLCEILKYCHARGVCHLALTLENVLVAGVPEDPLSLEVTLRGLGQAEILDTVTHRPLSEDELACMAPEQAGFVDSPTDTRSDVYSLGALLYRCLTGRAPYSAGTRFDLVHELVKSTPTRPVALKRDIPEEVDALVWRALAKQPGDRYSSIECLRSELDAIRMSRDSSASRDRTDFRDVYEGALRLSLIERGPELKRLRVQLDRAAQGAGSFIVVTGKPGAGKTSLVEELRSYCLAKRGLFLACHPTEMDSRRPFAAIREIIRQFVPQSRTFDSATRTELRNRLEHFVGHFGSDLLRSIPEVEELLPSSPELETLQPERQLQRAIKTILNFLLAIAGLDVPLVFFFDDFQWVDPGTRELVERLRERLADTRLLLICAADRIEPDASGLNADLPGAIRPSLDDLHIQLNALSRRGVRQLLEAGLGRKGPFVNDMAMVAYQRCGGNPRTLMEIVKTMRLELRADSQDDGSGGLLRLQSILPRAGSGALTRHRWNQIDEDSQSIIAAAAVIGRKFSAETLKRVVDRSAESVAAAVQEAVKHQVLSSWSVLEETWLCFVSDTVHQHVYSALDPERRRELHDRVVEALLERASDRDETLYDIAFHALRGGDQGRALEYALRAGDAAKRAYANAEASHFYSEALQRLAPERGELRVRLLENLGDVLALTGRYEQAESRYQELVGLVGDPVHEARLLGKIGDMFFRRGMNEEAIDNMTRGLECLGVTLPRGSVAVALSIVWNIGRHLCRSLLPRRWRYRSRPRSDDPREAAIEILHNLAYAYYFLDSTRTLAVHLLQLNLAESYGESRALAHTYSSHGVVCSLIPLHSRALRYQYAGLAMRERLGDRWGIGQSYAFLGVCCYYRGSLSQATQHLRRSIGILSETGDQWEIEAAYSHLGFCYNLLGELDAADEATRKLLELSEEISDLKFVVFSKASIAETESLRGNQERALNWVDEALELRVDHFSTAMALRIKGQILQRSDRLEEAREVLEESLALIDEFKLRNEYLVANYLVLAHVYLLQARRGCPERLQRLSEARRLLRRGHRLARRFPNHLGYAHRILALEKAVHGNLRGAAREFAIARKIFTRQGRQRDVARTTVENVRWTTPAGVRPDTTGLAEAFAVFRAIGAKRDLELARAWLEPEKGRLPYQSLRNESQQIASLFKISRTISSILELDRLVVEITDLALDVTNAERGYLFLARSNGKPEIRCARGLNRRDISINLTSEATRAIHRTWANGVAQATTIGLEDDIAGDTGWSVLCVPLELNEQPFGLLYMENRLGPNLYDDDDVEFFTVFASQAAVSIQNAILYRKAEELNLRLEHKVQDRTRELLKSKEELEKASRLKSEFLANMSHELRTPLNAVIAMSEILAEKSFGPLTEKQELYVKQILESGVHLLELINDVLDLSKVEAGQLELEMGPFLLEDLLKNSLQIVRENALKKRISLELKVDSSLDVVHGDARRIKQVLFNLLSNAVKFTPEGGHVEVEASADSAMATVCVSDTGIGISTEDQKIIFEEFRQADSSYSRHYEGTGLGLALSRKFVDMHGGKIWVESRVGEGSQFYFTLPLEKASEVVEERNAVETF